MLLAKIGNIHSLVMLQNSSPILQKPGKYPLWQEFAWFLLSIGIK
jgi:hypothetical protein